MTITLKFPISISRVNGNVDNDRGDKATTHYWINDAVFKLVIKITQIVKVNDQIQCDITFRAKLINGSFSN